MPKGTQTRLPVEAGPRVRRGYFECRFGQLHVHNAMPPGGGFEEGTPLLCLHDLTGSGHIFSRFMALAGHDRSVYAPDLPGFGESDGPHARPAIGDYAAAVGDFVDSLRLRQVALFALRGGALLATEMAIARPAQVTRVIMASVPMLTEPERHAARAQPSSAVSAAPAAAAAAADGAWRPTDWLRWPQEAAAQYPLRERLTKLTQRLLVLRTRDDLWEPTGRVREAVPAARLVDLEQPATELFVSQPERIAVAVREFLRA
ncbi:MAG TPA: alpha/beta fold hydrolase [Steroidobacteraceae bacterium]|nr:alpha/beta fold hydrolase [Steroidobacteraceae bacterium]